MEAVVQDVVCMGVDELKQGAGPIGCLSRKKVVVFESRAAVTKFP